MRCLVKSAKATKEKQNTKENKRYFQIAPKGKVEWSGGA